MGNGHEAPRTRAQRSPAGAPDPHQSEDASLAAGLSLRPCHEPMLDPEEIGRRADTPLANLALARTRPPLAAVSALQRLTGNASTAAFAGHLAAAERGRQGPVTPLPFRARLEATFGRSLSHVRAYTGPAAEEATRVLGARAYALGRDVIFAESDPKLSTVAHEVVHVLQLGVPSGPAAGPPAARIADPLSRAEQEAERLAGRVETGPVCEPSTRGDAGTVYLEREFPTLRARDTDPIERQGGRRQLPEGFWLGERIHEGDVAGLRENDIRLVMDAEDTAPDPELALGETVSAPGPDDQPEDYWTGPITYVEVPQTGSSFGYADEILAAFDAFRPQQVLIHCHHGADRTGTIVAFLLVLRYNWTIPEAFYAVLYPNQRYVDELNEILFESREAPKTSWLFPPELRQTDPDQVGRYSWNEARTSSGGRITVGGLKPGDNSGLVDGAILAICERLPAGDPRIPAGYLGPSSDPPLEERTPTGDGVRAISGPPPPNEEASDEGAIEAEIQRRMHTIVERMRPIVEGERTALLSTVPVQTLHSDGSIGRDAELVEARLVRRVRRMASTMVFAWLAGEADDPWDAFRPGTPLGALSEALADRFRLERRASDAPPDAPLESPPGLETACEGVAPPTRGQMYRVQSSDARLRAGPPGFEETGETIRGNSLVVELEVEGLDADNALVWYADLEHPLGTCRGATGWTRRSNLEVVPSLWDLPVDVYGLLMIRESWRSHVYLDRSAEYEAERRNPTVGMGHLLSDSENLEFPVGALVPVDRLEEWTRSDVLDAYRAAQRQAASIGVDDPDFIRVLTSVNFQHGTHWTGENPRTWALLQQHRWMEAADEWVNHSDFRDNERRGHSNVRFEEFQTVIRAQAMDVQRVPAPSDPPTVDLGTPPREPPVATPLELDQDAPAVAAQPESVTAAIQAFFDRFSRIPVEVPDGQGTTIVFVSAPYYLTPSSGSAGSNTGPRDEEGRRMRRRDGMDAFVSSLERGAEIGEHLRTGDSTPDDLRELMQEAVRQGRVVAEEGAALDGDDLRDWLVRYAYGVDCSSFVQQTLAHVGLSLGLDLGRIPSGSAALRGRRDSSTTVRLVEHPEELRAGDTMGHEGHVRLIESVQMEDDRIVFVTVESSSDPVPTDQQIPEAPHEGVGILRRTWRFVPRSQAETASVVTFDEDQWALQLEVGGAFQDRRRSAEKDLSFGRLAALEVHPSGPADGAEGSPLEEEPSNSPPDLRISNPAADVVTPFLQDQDDQIPSLGLEEGSDFLPDETAQNLAMDWYGDRSHWDPQNLDHVSARLGVPNTMGADFVQAVARFQAMHLGITDIDAATATRSGVDGKCGPSTLTWLGFVVLDGVLTWAQRQDLAGVGWESSAGWNASAARIGDLWRIPLDRLQHANQRESNEHEGEALPTAESAVGRAIVYVPVDAALLGWGQVDILLFLHGNGLGLRQTTEERDSGLQPGEVADISLYHVAEALEANPRPLIAICPQGTSEADFFPEGDAPALLDEVLERLREIYGLEQPPVAGQVIVVGHSGGGPEARGVVSAEGAPSVETLVLFEAINGPGERTRLWDELEPRIEEDLDFAAEPGATLDELEARLRTQTRYLLYCSGERYAQRELDSVAAGRTNYRRDYSILERDLSLKISGAPDWARPALESQYRVIWVEGSRHSRIVVDRLAEAIGLSGEGRPVREAPPPLETFQPSPETPEAGTGDPSGEPPSPEMTETPPNEAPWKVVIIGSPAPREVEHRPLQFVNAARALGVDAHTLWLVETSGYVMGNIDTQAISAMVQPPGLSAFFDESYGVADHLDDLADRSVGSLFILSHGVAGAVHLRHGWDRDPRDGRELVDYGIDSAEIQAIPERIFRPDAIIRFDSCNAGTSYEREDDSEGSLAEELAEHIHVPVSAWTGRTAYAFTNDLAEAAPSTDQLTAEVEGSRLLLGLNKEFLIELWSRARGRTPDLVVFVPEDWDEGEDYSWDLELERDWRSEPFDVEPGMTVVATIEDPEFEGENAPALSETAPEWASIELHSESGPVSEGDASDRRFLIGGFDHDEAWIGLQEGQYHLEIHRNPGAWMTSSGAVIGSERWFEGLEDATPLHNPSLQVSGDVEVQLWQSHDAFRVLPSPPELRPMLRAHPGPSLQEEPRDSAHPIELEQQVQTPAPETPLDLLDDLQVVNAIDYNRTRDPAFHPSWVLALQGALRVPAESATGVFNRATVQAIASFQASVSALAELGPDGKLGERTLTELGEDARFPDLGSNQRFTPETALPQPTVDAVGPPGDARDRGARAAGYVSYEAYREDYTTTPFLGGTLTGHPILLRRVELAMAWLRQGHPGTTDVDIADELGVSADSQDFSDLRSSGTSYHTFGLAVHVNYETNPWVGGNPGAQEANRSFVDILGRAVAFMGFGEPFDPATSSTWATLRTTDELWETYRLANQALVEYRAMVGDAIAVEEQLRRRNGTVAPDEISSWLQAIAEDDAALRGDDQVTDDTNWDRTNGTARVYTGFMDHALDLVRALRDAAGLAWGACDYDGQRQDGDFHHFDARTVDEARAIVTAAKS